jgi:general stress protein 26
MLVLFQSYIIWQDRINKISMVTYSYGSGYERNMDTAFVAEIKYSQDYIEACVLIQDKTKRSNIMIHSWQNIYKDRATIVEWKLK